MKLVLFLNGILILMILVIMPYGGYPQTTRASRIIKRVENQLNKLDNTFPGWPYQGMIRVDSFSIHQEKNLLEVFFSSPLSYFPIREKDVDSIEESVKGVLGRKFKKFRFDIYSDHHLLKELIPNPYRLVLPIDSSRISGAKDDRVPIVQRIGQLHPANGLFNRNIAVWNSHGWYYESKLDRWEWQRARLFGTVEDIYTMTYVLPYLVPMLENSGASVFLPRERDWQANEVIVDDDRSSAGSELILPNDLYISKEETGFLLKDTLNSGENPFELGRSLSFPVSKNSDQFVKYIPSIPVKGRYSVSVSYKSGTSRLSEVKYSVYHAGGKSEFLVNQKLGGSTWVYLGTFDFNSGKHPETGMVTVNCSSGQSGTISTDAVKFGGGMGQIARRPADEAVPNQRSLVGLQIANSEGVIINPQLFNLKLSGKARYLEGARYYLQSAGFPDSMVYNLNKNKNDYNDDYQSRGEWVNFLMGNPNGPADHRKLPGLNIPVDLAFAFHTDAGVTPNDSIVGTLGIYSTISDQGRFPNGKSKMASRDLADLIQTQIVSDVRLLYNPKWTRRGLWDKQYSEAWRPNVPTMLLELFSHQNLADMKFGLDPRFRFDVSRAIYKGMLRFLSYQDSRPYVVQPLPVDHFSLERLGNESVKLSWRAVNDPLEPTAGPARFKVYKRLDDNGFDNGIIVNDTVLVLNLDLKDRIYSFKVTAINEGGESFPGEILSVGIKSGSKGDILVVNGFNRICGPSVFDNGETAGVAWWKDQGVADHQDIGFVGFQYDFDRKSQWLDDDSPGWGASYGDMEGKVIPGNSFDYPLVHGKAIMDAGYSFVSVSDEVFCEPSYDTKRYFATDLIMGEERSTPNLKDPVKSDYQIYTPSFMSKVSEITKNRGNLFISGAYIGSEFGEKNDSVTAAFVKEHFHFIWRTGHASKGGKFYSTDYASKWIKGNWSFNTGYDPKVYSVEAPDGIEPDGKSAITAFRYGENNVSAGILYHGDNKVVAMGIPFETILNTENQDELMKQILNFFATK